MANIIIWIIAFLSIAGVIIRPLKIPEATWAVSGAVLLVVLKLISPAEAMQGVTNGTDVYLFLTGMMLLAETARQEKLFDFIAALATKFARGSANRFFLLIYIAGLLVTIFLSNDATAVVLTPAVAAAAARAKVKNPLPYLFICAFVANAASFVLPISNPANLVIYGKDMPSLLHWLPQFIVPSIVSIVMTYFILRFTQRQYLKEKIESNVPVPILSFGGKLAIAGIGFTAVVLLSCSVVDISLGLPTFITGVLTSLTVIILGKTKPLNIVKGISWSILFLVAGLFLIVEALNKTGAIATLTAMLQQRVAHSVTVAVWESSFVIAFASNFMNNLPAGLIAGNVLQSAHLPPIIKSAVLIGVDLGPNLSVTGSLATILWLISLRRAGLQVTAWGFFKTGIIVMTVALFVTILSLWI